MPVVCGGGCRVSYGAALSHIHGLFVPQPRTGHWLLRTWLAGYLLIDGWSKVFFLQMGLADYADHLVRSFPPVPTRRGLGALLAALDLIVGFLLNLTFEVPVKQLSGIMAVAGIIVLIPNLTRLCRFLVGKPTGTTVALRISGSS